MHDDLKRFIILAVLVAGLGCETNALIFFRGNEEGNSELHISGEDASEIDWEHMDEDTPNLPHYDKYSESGIFGSIAEAHPGNKAARNLLKNEEKYTLPKEVFDPADVEWFFSHGEQNLTSSRRKLATPETFSSGKLIAYTGVWRQPEPGTGYLRYVTWDYLQTAIASFKSSRVFLTHVDFVNVPNNPRFNAIFKTMDIASTDHVLLRTNSASDFDATWKDLHNNKGLRLMDIEMYLGTDNKVTYMGIFYKVSGAPQNALLLGLSWSAFVKQFKDHAAMGYRLIDFERYVGPAPSKPQLFAGLFLKDYVAGSKEGLLYVYKSSKPFINKWTELSDGGHRLIDIEQWDSYFAGVFQTNAGGNHALYINVDAEEFDSYYWHASQSGTGISLIDLESKPTSCDAGCGNNVVGSRYVYVIDDGTTTMPAMNWPAISDPTTSKIYVRLSAVRWGGLLPPRLRLPFSDTSVRQTSGWIYDNAGYHYALDYGKYDSNAKQWVKFNVLAADAGTVKFVGWDKWSGNTVVIEHSQRWRTVYMHLMNGATAGCNNAWSISIPTLSGNNLKNYTDTLVLSGCKQNDRKPNVAYWGTDSDLIAVKVGDSVNRGQFIAKAGATGPGGKRGNSLTTNIHLHLFTLYKDPEDEKWYFIDPYGVYGERAKGNCYPAKVTDPLTSCSRYKVAWALSKKNVPMMS